MRRMYAWILTILLVLPCAGLAEREEHNTMAVLRAATQHLDGEPEQLWPCIQPIGTTWQVGALEVRLIDALLVDGALAIAWTVENHADETLYIMDSVALEGVRPGGFIFHGFGTVLGPGETLACGIAGNFDGAEYAAMPAGGKTLELAVAGLRLGGELMDWTEVGDGTLYMNDRDAYDREVDRLFAEEGRLVVEGGGYLASGAQGLTYTQDMAEPREMHGFAENGRLRLDAAVYARAALREDSAARSLLSPEQVLVPINGGTLRMVRADLSPASLVIEAVFEYEDRELAETVQRVSERTGSSPVLVLDARGERSFSCMGSMGLRGDESGGWQTEPMLREDGIWEWKLSAEYWYIAPVSGEYTMLVGDETEVLLR